MKPPMPSVYYTTGFPFDGKRQECSPEQTAALDALVLAFWGEDRTARITIAVQQPPARRRCTKAVPECWGRVNNPDAPCTCSGFEGGNEIVITRRRPKGKRQGVAE